MDEEKEPDEITKLLLKLDYFKSLRDSGVGNNNRHPDDPCFRRVIDFCDSEISDLVTQLYKIYLERTQCPEYSQRQSSLLS